VLAELQTLNGLPAHPLLVHLPVVMIPLALIGAIIALARPPWRSWAVPVTAVFATLGFAGVQLAVMSGEGLEELSGEEGEAIIERHAHLAEQARPIVFVFFLLAVAAAVIVYLLHRDGEGDTGRTATLRKLAAPVLALSVLTGALSTVWVYRTGHTGAEAVWKGEGEKEGGEKGEKSTEGGDERPAGDVEGDDDGD
jgi:hypothetical protein